MIKKSFEQQLREFGQRVRREIPVLLGHYESKTDAGSICYVDQPGQSRRVRPWCDALEIGAAFGMVPAPLSTEEWIHALQGFQNAETGLVPEYLPDDRHLSAARPAEARYEDRYNTMIVNYALECLGSHLAVPVHNAEEIDASLLTRTLETLTWERESWGAGHWIDCYASCLYANRRYFQAGAQIEVLLAWLDAHVDRDSGLWGKVTAEQRWLQPVNGFYRLTRGTYAQFDQPLPEPERAIDTLLLHAADGEFFHEGRGNACNVLDVVHPLWLCARQTNHRRKEGLLWVEQRLPDILGRWVTERGMAFDSLAEGERGVPGLQGTEMWLSIIFLMADYLGISAELGYRPRGTHRIEPAWPLGDVALAREWGDRL